MTTQATKSSIFIEREQPLSEIKRIFQEVETKKLTKILLIKGDFGIGKTTLVENFITKLKQENKNVVIGKASCSLQTQQNGLIPFKDVLIEIGNNESRTKAFLGVLFNLLKEIAPAWADIVTAGRASLVKDAINKTITFGRENGNNKYTQDNVYVQFANIVRKLSEKNTLLLFLDDIHWADETSLGLIAYISKVITNKPILIIVTYREADLFGRDDYSQCSIIIDNLIRYGAAQLELKQGISTLNYITFRYPRNDFPSEVISKIDQISEGHPMFLDELFTYWEQIGIIYESSKKGQKIWTLKSEIDIQKDLLNIPSSVTIIVKNRLQLMEKNLKEIIQNAAVEGVTFTAQVMSELNLVEETELFDSLTLLEKNYYLIQRDGEIDRSDIVLDLYKFIKNFYREFIYSQIDPGKRRLIHKKIADLLEKLYDGETDSIASKLIYHNRESHNFERSIHYCINGAKYEQMNYGWIEAEKMCKEGLSLCEKIKEEKGRWRLTFELLKISAKGLYICGNVDLAHSRYTEIANIIPSINVSLEENLEFLLDFIDACEDSNRISEAIIYIKKVEEIIENSNYSGKYKNQFVIYKSWEYIRTGQNKKAVEILKGLLDDIDENDQNFWILSLAYNGLGIATSNLGDPSSIDYLRKAVFYGEKLGTDKRQGIALLNLADDLLYYNKVVEASAYNDKALLLVRKIGDRDGEAYGLANKGRIELMYKKPESAISFLNDCMVILDEIGSAWNKSFVLSDLAVSYSFLGNQAIALEKIDLADRYIENDPFRLLYVVRSKAQLLCNLGKPLEGLDLFRKALEICDQSDDIYFKYETLSDYADELEKIGDFTQAQKIRSEIPKNFNL